MSSKFDKILGREKPKTGERERPAKRTDAPAGTKKAKRPSNASSTAKKTRPMGKSRDRDNFVQMVVYVRRETHLHVKIALMKKQPRMELSELVEDQLSKWLMAQG